MCARGSLLKVVTYDAPSALQLRELYATVIRSHSDWELDEVAANVILTELLANVDQHGAFPALVELECAGGMVKLHLSETGNGFSQHPELPADVFSESGRGLFLVSNFAVELEIAGNPRGTYITAGLPRLWRSAEEPVERGSAGASAQNPPAIPG